MTQDSPRPPETRLRERRVARGVSQQDLAARCGLTRQSIGAIESGRYVPNTGVALALARELGCRVEDLFRLPDEAAAQPVELAAAPAGDGERVVVAAVRDRLVAHPLGAEHELQAGFLAADALLEPARGARGSARARLLTPPHELDRTALVVGCDPGLGILRAHVERRGGDVHLRCLAVASRGALQQLRAGHAHVAGTHLHDPASGMHNLPQARRALARTGGLVVRFASWEQGLVVAGGNPLAIRGVADLARPRVRFVNRDPGAGIRALLDEMLGRAGVAAARIAGYEREVGTHVAAAACVAAGGADAALSLRATARAFGLGFVPLAASDFDLVVPHDLRDHPAVAALLDALAGDALRRDLAALAGYDVSRTGSVIAEVPARAG